jgi:hypothetical protein
MAVDVQGNTRGTSRQLFERVLSSRSALSSVLVIATVLRVGHVLALLRLPLFDNLIVDSKLYDEWAQRIAAGDWLGGDRAFYMDPLYPYLLAFLYRSFGHSLLIVRLFQAALGVATCGFVAIIGRRIGGRAVGTVSALLVALYQPLIFEGGEIEKTALGVFLITASFVFATQGSLASKFGAGSCLALATLTRGNMLLMAPLGAVYFLVDSEPSGSGTRAVGFTERWRGRFLGKSGRSTIAFCLGFLLFLSPVLWRNHFVSGEWILTTSQLGTNFYTGNNPANWLGTWYPVPFVRPLPSHEEEDFRSKAQAMIGTTLTPTEVSSFWFMESVKHIMKNPWFALEVFFRKFTLFWSNLEVPDGWGMYFIKQYSPALRLSPVTLGWLLPLAFLGAAASFRLNREIRLLVGFVAAYSLSLIAFFIFSRYRAYVGPPLAVLAALGVRWIWDHVQRHDWRHAIPGALAAGCVCAFSFFGASTFIGLRPGNFVHNYAHLAELYEDKGDFKSAEALLHEGLQRQPKAESLLCAFGSLYLRTNNPEQALIYIHQCLQVNEQYPNAWFLLGVANEKLDRIDEAKRSFKRQLEITSDHQLAKKHLESLMALPEKTGP